MSASRTGGVARALAGVQQPKAAGYLVHGRYLQGTRMDGRGGKMRVLALAAALALADAWGGDRYTVWRPTDWGGPFRKDKDIRQ